MRLTDDERKGLQNHAKRSAICAGTDLAAALVENGGPQSQRAELVLLDQREAAA